MPDAGATMPAMLPGVPYSPEQMMWFQQLDRQAVLFIGFQQRDRTKDQCLYELFSFAVIFAFNHS